MAYCVSLVRTVLPPNSAYASDGVHGAGFIMYTEQGGVTAGGLSQIMTMADSYTCNGAVLLQGKDWTQYQSYLAATTVDPTVCAQFFAFGITIVVPAYLVSHYAGAITRFISGFLR